jgi:hypothetical protein
MFEKMSGVKMKLLYEDVINFLQRKEADVLKIPFIEQRGDYTCWAACYEMVDKWRNQARNGCEYIDLQTGDCKEKCFRLAAKCDKARPVASVMSDWWKLGYKGTLEYPNNLSENEIRSSIKKKKPVQAFIKFRDKPIGHYILILGIERHCFSADALIVIMDPSSGYSTRSFGELFKWGNWQFTWVVS